MCFRIPNLRKLDLSKNKLKSLERLQTLTTLKSLQCEDNQLVAGSLGSISKLSSLQTLRVGGNPLGRPPPPPEQARSPLPSKLPKTLKTLALDRALLSAVPPPVLTLVKLETLDLSSNHLASVPTGISSLQQLRDLNLDHNVIVSLPDTIGQLSKLKTLSLRGNKISVQSTVFSDKNPQPLPASLFADTPVIDLNLHGNPMTSTQLNEFDGFSKFLERRQKIKTKDLYGGALTNLEVCGLE